MSSPARPAPAREWGWALPALVTLVAIAMVVAFDLATNLALSDEWMFRWPISQLAIGRGLHLWPGVLPVALLQVLAAAPLAVAGAEPRWWRLTVVPFVVLAALCSAALSRRQGADRFWAAVAAGVVVASPIYLSVATGLTSDIAYLGLLMAALLAGLRWLESGRGAPLAVALAILATLERQHGIAVAPALAVGLLMARSKRGVARREWGWLAVASVGTILAIALPFLAGWASSTMADVGSGRGRLHPTAGSVAGTLLELGPVLALLFLPLVVSLLPRDDAERRTHNRLAMIPVVVGTSGAVAALVFALYFGVIIWPGNVWTSSGLGPTHIGGAKPALVDLRAFLALEALTIAAIVVLFCWRRRAWLPGSLGTGGVFLVTAALLHLAPMPFTSPLDRYYLAVALPLVPVLAGIASRGCIGSPRLAGWAAGWAVGCLVVGVVYYAFAEQDYLAWQQARDQAARLVYGQVDPALVDAGYEATASHVAVPVLAATGRVVIDPIDLIPAHPRVRLLFAPADDRRPGVSWNSISPGRIVVVCAQAGATADLSHLAASCP